MASFSFDIVSEYDKAELNNVFDQTKREIASRYDFKATPANIDWLGADKTGFVITGNSQLQLDAIIDIIRKKLAARNQSQKMLDVSESPTENNFQMSQNVPFIRGLTQEKAKTISKLIQAKYPKVKTSIQGETLRVVSGSKDELQAVITLVRQQDYDFPLGFINYR